MPQKKKAPARQAFRAKVALRRDTTLEQSDIPRRVEPRMAPPPKAERQHARPGAGIKRSRGVMVKKLR